MIRRLLFIFLCKNDLPMQQYTHKNILRFTRSRKTWATTEKPELPVKRKDLNYLVLIQYLECEKKRDYKQSQTVSCKIYWYNFERFGSFSATYVDFLNTSVNNQCFFSNQKCVLQIASYHFSLEHLKFTNFRNVFGV